MKMRMKRSVCFPCPRGTDAAVHDVSRPIRIVTPDGEFDVRVHPSEETLGASILKTDDPALAWVAEIPYGLLHK